MAIPKPDPKMLDDIARVAGGAVNIFSGLQDQIRSDMRARVEDVAARLDLVPRDEMDRATGMIEKLRREMRALEERVAVLEHGTARTKKAGVKKETVKKKTGTQKKAGKKA